MRNLPLQTLILPLLLGLPCLAQTSAAEAPEPPDLPAMKPNPFLVAHERYLKVARENTAELLFLGDSITEWWNNARPVFDSHFGKYKTANFGIAGDRTQHVLWRITNGELDGFTPKALVLMIGTNNVGGDSAEGIAAGISKIVRTIQEKTPKTKILLLGVFPRGEKPSPVREKQAQVNQIISKLHDGNLVHYLDITGSFLEQDGSISKEVMYDFLHLTPKGYDIWANAISAKVEELMR